MRKSEMNSLVAGVKVQSKKDSTVYEIAGLDKEQQKAILTDGKVYSFSTLYRWFNLYVEPVAEEKEDTEEQDTTADTEEQTNTDTTATTATNIQVNELHEDADTAVKKDIVEANTGTIRQNNLITDTNNLMDLHDVQMEAKKEYIKVSIPGKRGALCMIRPTRFGTGIHIDMKSKVMAALDENYRGMLIQDYNCQIYDKTRGYFRVFDCSDLDVLETIILTAKQVG